MYKLIVTLLVSVFLTGNLYAEQATQESVAKLYIATFDRVPDRAGLDYWVYDSGFTQENIAKSFFDQEETKEKYPIGTSNEEFIDSIYINLFKRTPDDEGMSYWNNALNSGSVAKSTFILAVTNGAKGDDAILLSNKTDVGLAFANSGNNDASEAKNVLLGVTTDRESVINTLNSFGLSLPNKQKDQKKQKFITRYISRLIQSDKIKIDDDYSYYLKEIDASMKEFEAGMNYIETIISSDAVSQVILNTVGEYLTPLIIAQLNLKDTDEKAAQAISKGLINILILRKTKNEDITKVKKDVLKDLIANNTVYAGYRFATNSEDARQTLDLMIDYVVYIYDSGTGLTNPGGFMVSTAKMLGKLAGMVVGTFFADDAYDKYKEHIVLYSYLDLLYLRSEVEDYRGVINVMIQSKSRYAEIRENATYDEVLEKIYEIDAMGAGELGKDRLNIIKNKIRDFDYRLKIFYKAYLKQEEVLAKHKLEPKPIYIYKPTLIYPSPYTFLPLIDVDYIEFGWESVISADRYKFSLYNTTDKVSVYEGDVSDTGEFYTFKPISNLPMGKSFSWKVKACSTSNNDSCSDWSEGTFRTAKESEPQIEIPNKPTLTSPASNIKIYDTYIQLKWETVDNADSYELSVFNATDNISIFKDTVYTNSKKVSSLPVGKLCFWTVKACNSSGCSKNSLRRFSTKEKEEVTKVPNIPTLIYPARKATVDSSAKLKWGVVSNANSYRVSIYNYVTKSYSSSMVYTNSKPVSSLASGVPLLWSVAACNNAGCSGDSSQRLVSIK